jgi:hypothetical protein
MQYIYFHVYGFGLVNSVIYIIILVGLHQIRILGSINIYYLFIMLVLQCIQLDMETLLQKAT